MKRYLDKDVIAGLFLMAFGAVYYRVADGLPRSLLSDRVGAAGFPKLLGGALIVLSAVLIVMSLLRQVADPARREGDVEKEYRFLNASGMLSIGIVYLLIVSWVGYLIGIALLMVAALLYQGEHLSRKMLITSLLGGVLFWAFFVYALKTPMPAGIWPALLGGG